MKSTRRQHNQRLAKITRFLKAEAIFRCIATNLPAYKTIIRPEQEYASMICRAHQNYITSKLQSVQNKAARFILNDFSPESSVSACEFVLGLPLIPDRRKINRMCFFHPIYYS